MNAPRTSAVMPFRPSLKQMAAAYWFPAAAIGLRLASSPTANAAYVLVAIYALLGPRQAIFSLYLCWLLNMVNHGIAPPAGFAAIARHAIIFAAFASAVIHLPRLHRGQLRGLLPATIALCVFLVMHSLVFSFQPDVSMLKAVSFSMTVLALLICWAEIGDKERTIAGYFLFGSLGVIAFASIPFVALPAGYFRDGKGFQGVLVHPQNFGPTMAVLASVLVAKYLTDKKLALWTTGILGLSITWILLSRARIGGLAFVAGVVLGSASDMVRGWLSTSAASLRIRRVRLFYVIAASVIAAVAAGPWLAGRITEYVQKGAETESLTETAMASRGMIIDTMLRNIESYPAAGIGFGVGSDLDYYAIVRDPFLGLPVMATVEKGVMPIAVVEETGFLGALVTYPWLLFLAVRAAKGGLVSSIVFWTVLATNIAEANFFSPGGQGMFQLIFATWGCTAPPISMPRQAAAASPLRRAA